MNNNRKRKYHKIFKDLNDSYEKDRCDFLNDRRIIQYLFEQPLEPIDNFQTNNDNIKILSTLNDHLNSECNPIYLSTFESSTIEAQIIALTDSREKYTYVYSKYLQEYPRSRARLPYIPRLLNKHSLLQKIQNLLDDQGISYVRDFDFGFRGEQTTTDIPYSFNYQLKVDILGCVTDRTRGELTCTIHLFAIIDTLSKSNVKEVFERDFIDQFCLRKMRIHLIRLDRRTDLNNFIRFIKKIKRRKTQYHGKNLLVARSRDSKWLAMLEQFYESYNYNHILFCNKFKADLMKETESYDISLIETELDPEPDEDTDCIVSNDFLNRLTSKKYILTGTRKITDSED